MTSDVLSRMIARTGGRISQVQPVHSSRYEPNSVTESLAAFPETEAVDYSGSSAAAKPAIPRSAEVPEPPGPRGIKTRATVPGRKTAQQGPAPVIEALISGRILPVAAHAVPQAKAADSTNSPRDAFAAARATLPMNSPMEAAHDGTVKTSPRMPAPEISFEPIELRAIQKSMVHENEENEQSLEPTGQTLASPAARSSFAHEHEKQALPAAPAESAEVNVTIGSIELRLAPPAKASTRKNAPPRVSLQEYLQRRNESLR